MAPCSGNCSSCGGCGKELLLTQEELDMLNTLAQVAFLPVARKADDMTPVYLEADATENSSLVLQVLEKKGLIDIDYRCSLKGCDMGAYGQYPIRGTIGLTERGQTVIDLLDRQGIADEKP